ncbi:MAG: homoserine O-succinyltransferase [Alphaproteobacteria bacterium]|nr:homoserine O-succinyltransferase [Alphaproteobacteria bacterium]
MPVLVRNNLPVIARLEDEGLFVMKPKRAHSQKIRPLKIALVNLMPTKEATELQFLRLLSNSPLQIGVTLLRMDSHQSKNTDEAYLKQFYTSLKSIKTQRFDGMIITGAPVETLPFEEVDFWPEISELMDYTRQNVFSTLHICWGAQAGLYHHYGINKVTLPQKKFGVFVHRIVGRHHLLFKGADEQIYMPHSRHTGWLKRDIKNNPNLSTILYSKEAGPAVIMAHKGRQIFISGHFEYDADTLANEYFRDKNKGLPIHLPEHYFKDGDPKKGPIINWRAHANLIFSNWLNYMVYQRTPYDLSELTSI